MGEMSSGRNRFSRRGIDTEERAWYPVRSGGDGILNQGEFSNQHQGLSIDVLLFGRKESQGATRPRDSCGTEGAGEEARAGGRQQLRASWEAGVHVHLSQDCQEPSRPPPGQEADSQETGCDGPVGSGLLLGQSVVPSLAPGSALPETDVAMVSKFRGCGQLHPRVPP